jgi:hypothetical protein
MTEWPNDRELIANASKDRRREPKEERKESLEIMKLDLKIRGKE